MRRSDAFIIAAWAALFFGLIEGLILNITRSYPVILAPYKASAHVMWIAPLVDIAVFLLTGVGWFVLLSFKPVRNSRLSWWLLYGFYIFLGAFAVLSAPELISDFSAIGLALGIIVGVVRKFSDSLERLTRFLRARVVWIPVPILLVALGVTGYAYGREELTYRRLPRPPQRAANVLVIVLDTVRYDRFARAYKNGSLTPNLNRLAAKGARFENAWATASWSLPSQASILTGRYPFEHKADWPGLDLNPGDATMADAFSEMGYVTGAFSGNSAWVTPEYLGQGFLRFQVYIPENYLRRTSLGRLINRAVEKIGLHSSGYGKKAPQINTEFVKFLRDYPTRPYFAYLCYMDVNQAFHKRALGNAFWEERPSVRDEIEAYDQGLAVLDAQIGNLFSQLERMGALENTLVIITSDHGESFGAAGTDNRDHDPEGHGTSLYPEQVRVPLFVIYPEKVAPGQVINETVSLRSIPSTIQRLVGVAGAHFEDEPLPLAASQINPSDRDTKPILATLNYDQHRLQSVIWTNWLYLKNLGIVSDTGEELYNLEKDPLARNNIADQRKELSMIRRMLQALLKPKQLSERPLE
jgi:arylsulfatase A-like enzyme